MIEQLKSGARGILPARIYGPLRARRVRRLIAGFAPRTVEHVYAGFRLKIRLEDPLAEGWYDHDWIEQPEIRELQKGRLRPGARVIDIGAHQGVVALILARIVGAEGRVVAVEAELHNAEVARRNVVANDATNLTVLQAAAGAASGVLSFTESLNGNVACGGARGVEVRSVTVDELASRHGLPDVVLIDVEGYEAHVLAGARATIAAATTDFFVELHPASMLAAAGSTADDVMGPFLDGPFDVTIAVADETAPAVAGGHRAITWQDAGSHVHRQGLRCFVVARPRASATPPATGP